MPQLTIETFVSQYFWLILTLSTLYFLMVNKYIPLISEGFKARANIDTKVNVHKNLIKDTVLIKDIASLKYTQSTAIPSHSTPFINNFSTWSNKY